MDAPLVVEVRRGPHPESRHEVDVVVVDGDLQVQEFHGEPDRPVLPRSAAKPIQAIPLIESGAAAAFGSGDAELAVACSSHGGEPAHVAVVDAWLRRLGLGVDALECGASAPVHPPSERALVAAGRPPDARHNTCSGKHCAFLCVCRHLDLDPSGYIRAEHPLQRRHVTPALEQLCGVTLRGETPAVEGCGIPVWRIPLDRLAVGWASLRDRPAGARLLEAMAAEPHLVAGTGLHDTRLMTEAGGRLVVKTGAEGVYGAVTDEGVAVALKVRDGATRAAEAAVTWMLERLGVIGPQQPVVLRNWAGTEVGTVRVVV